MAPPPHYRGKVIREQKRRDGQSLSGQVRWGKLFMWVVCAHGTRGLLLGRTVNGLGAA